MPSGPDLVPVLRALVDGDRELAASLARGSADAEGSLLAGALSTYLAEPASASVYVDPAAFEAFIRGGGNVPLYEAVSAALARTYEQRRPARLLDIGCGDGTALVPALAASSHRPSSLDVVEPSSALLESALARLRAIGTPVRSWPVTLQEVLQRLDGDGTTAWDVAQSTFALHTLPHAERTAALAALRPRVGVLVVVEFDVPDLLPGSDEHLDVLARSYEVGLAEYDADRDLVAQGFLMPVLTGQLAPGAVRATWEQPARAWADQVRAAGYRDVEVSGLCDYWSSPAFLLTARGGA